MRTPLLDHGPRGMVAEQTLRAFYAFAAAAAVAAIANLATTQLLVQDGTRHALMAGYALFFVCCVLAMRLSRPRARQVVMPLLLAGLAVIFSVAVATGWGLRSPGMYVLGVLCCMACAVATPPQGLTLTAVAIGLVGALGWGEATHLLPDLEGMGGPTLFTRMLVQATAIALGAGAGLMLARLSDAYVRAAGDREQRFRELLAIAAHAYWETDAEMRLRHISRREEASQFVSLPLTDPVAVWEIDTLRPEGAPMSLLQARMQAHESLRDVLMRWSAPDGRTLMLLVSGEPRHRSDGSFRGYWGVARDVTAEQRARSALIDTELRYRDLFRRTPSPMLLHRDGVVVDANEAAAQMLGLTRGAELVGETLDSFYDEADRALLHERMVRVLELPAGQALPPADFTLVRRDGRRVTATVTGVRADIGGKSTALAIYIDQTRQLAAAAAQQRSEALLRQLISVSPDVITLTELNSGRYELVSQSFYRLTGYGPTEVLGHTSGELGIWASGPDRQRLTDALRHSDSVQDMAVDFQNRQGQRLPMLISATRFVREGRPYLVINARDMTQANRERLEREAIMANASVGLAHTRNHQLVMVNPRFEQMYGWPSGQLLGQPARLVWRSDEEYESLGAQIGPALRRGEQVDIERIARRHDGSTFLARLRAKAIDPEHPTTGGTIWIAEDVTSQRQAADELARAKEAAEAASRAKSAFLANTSHEIRTPLNGLVGLARMARQPNVPAERLQGYLEQIGHSAETLSMIISDILDLSKIEAGRLEVELAPFDLPALMHSLHLAYEGVAIERGLRLELDLGADLPELVEGDSLRVRQILANYLHNALKFTPQGTVLLSARAVGGERMRFEVCDTGPGIAPEIQARLFKPFSQADESITRRFGGTGLGLSICHQLATLMGGSVGLQSTPGAGSCFHVELPLPAVSAAAAVSGHGAFDVGVLQGARVLLVEDNPVNMMIGVALLEQWGMTVVQAESGAAALQLVAEAAQHSQPMDAVLMDVQMPGMSGHEATRRLREHWRAQQLPIIALTAAALVSEREQAFESGMNDFVTKPIEPNRLRQALVKALSHAAE